MPTQASARETTSDDEQDVEWEHGDPSALGLETDSGLWTPLTSNPALGGVTASRVTLRFPVTLPAADDSAVVVVDGVVQLGSGTCQSSTVKKK